MTRRPLDWLLVAAVVLAYLQHVLYGEFVYEDAAWLTVQGGSWRPRGLTQYVWAWQWSIWPSPSIPRAPRHRLRHRLPSGSQVVYSWFPGLVQYASRDTGLHCVVTNSNPTTHNRRLRAKCASAAYHDFQV